MAEVRLFHQGKFLCRAICPELAGQTVALRDILRARAKRRLDLRQTLKARRATAVDVLLDLRRGEPGEATDASHVASDQVTPETPTLKRYRNE